MSAEDAGAPRSDEYRKRLEQAIAAFRSLVDSCTSDLDRGRWLQNLAVSLRQRSELWPDPDPRRRADLQEGLAATEKGLQLHKGSEWDKVHLLATRAELRRILAGNLLDASVEEAYVAAMEAAHRTTHDELIPIATDWQHMLGDNGRCLEAAAAGDTALSMLETLVDRQPHQHYKQVYLRQAAGLAEETAVARVRAGDANSAVPTLERALAVFWRQRYLDPRRIATRLAQAGSEDLAEEYLSLVAAARDLDSPDRALRTAEGRLEELRPAIGQIIGEGDFDALTQSRSHDLPATLSLHLATSRSGSVALVRDARGRVRSIDLPKAAPSEIHQVAFRYRQEVVSDASVGQLAYSTATEVVSWLEDAILRPIEAAIVELLGREENVSKGAPTLTVVPTGSFTGLPLHAARLKDGRPLAVLGLSYAPALSALDSHPLRLGPATKVLIVADPARPEVQSLEGAVLERQALSATWPKAVVLSGDSATVSAVRAALPKASVVHLACHGRSDDREPLHSAVLLADGEFTMRDVLSARLKPGSLVVLSACQTAVHDPSVPGEAMSLAGSFLAAGASAVVASLWPVPDYATAALMGAFHETLRAGSSPAHALGAAQSAMAAGKLTDARDGGDWRSPYFWAGFIALGGAGAPL